MARTPVRACSCVLFGLLLFVSCGAAQHSGAYPDRSSGSVPYTFHITTREVLIDVIARNRRNQLVKDLKLSDFQVYEILGRGRKAPMPLAALRAVNPSAGQQDDSTPLSGFRVSLGGICAARTNWHYVLAWHPNAAGWTGGYHRILIRTDRPGVRLFYHPRYFVGQKTAPANLSAAAKSAQSLEQAACYHPATPLSIALTARTIRTALTGVVREFVTIDPDSLPFISMPGWNHQVHLDYGVCTFTAAGKPIQYFHASIDRTLTTDQYAQTTVHGFPIFLQLPRERNAAMARVAVRDRATGNIGRVDMMLAPPASDELTASEQASEKAFLKTGGHVGPDFNFAVKAPPLGPLGSFGSIVPVSNSFCGNVYQIPDNATHLPNFWSLDSLGTLYTRSFFVPHQQFWNTGGISGITRRTAWFGIDYWGTFWVRQPGKYTFELFVDDGAKLYIDDDLVIDLNGLHMAAISTGGIKLSSGPHMLHLAYFQGPPTSVGLVLLVKPPNGKFQTFDLKEFGPPPRRSNTRAAR